MSKGLRGAFKAAMAQMAGQLWEAPAMERREFVSWDDFFAYMKEYQQRTHQSFSRRSATSVKTRNQVLAAMAKSGRPIPSPLLPESFLDYTRMLQCSHKLRGDAAHTHARWNGEQPSECQARINATLQLGDYGKYFIRATKVSLLHNHPVGGDARPVSVAAVQTATSSAVASGQEDPSLAAKRRRVETQHKPEERQEGASSHTDRQTAKEAQQRVPTMADVRMFLERVEISRSNQPGAGQSVEERLAAYVNEFAAQEGNAAKIFVDNEKVLSSVTLQTKHMRQVFEAFPEVLRVDAMPPTTGSSESSYRVFSLMAHDTLGQWQYVQHAIVENDRSETLRVALDQFKAHNPRHTRVRALIVLSGDSNQLKELRASFPAARVLYSQFHVLRSLHKVIAEHGDLSSWHRDRLTGIAQLLVYAPTSLVYAANIAVMVDVLGSKQHSFFRYFLEKWDVCRDRWSTFAREGVTTFSMSESDGPFAPTWNAIFAAVNDEMALDETVAAIRYYQTVVERAFVRELNFQVNNSGVNSRVAGSNSGEDYDAEMRLVAATVGPAASSLIFPQYRYAVTRGAYQFCEPSRGSFFISTVSPNDIFCDEPSKEFCVEVDRGWQCSCAFMVNHHLPCRHVFYIRRIVRCSTVIPLENLEPRWVLAKARDFFNSSQVSESTGDALTGPDTERGNATAPPPGAWQKFVTAQEVGKRIGYRMMEMEPEEFDRALRFYKLVETTMSVRPFDLNAGIAARINSQNGGLARASAQKPNWVEPDPTRTLAPRSGPPGVAGTVYVSSNDRMAAAVAARNMQQAQMAQRYRRPSATRTKEVIDLQDESEEEEKAEETTESGQRVEAEQSEGNQEDNNVEASEVDSVTDRPSDDQDTTEKAAVPASNQDEDEDPRPEQDPSSGDEAVHSTPRIREPWEVIDELEKDQDDEEGDNNNDRLL